MGRGLWEKGCGEGKEGGMTKELKMNVISATKKHRGGVRVGVWMSKELKLTCFLLPLKKRCGGGGGEVSKEVKMNVISFTT